MPIFKPFGVKAHTFITRHPNNDTKYTLLEGSVRSSKTWAVNAKIILQLCKYMVSGKRVILGVTKQTVYKNILLDIFSVIGKDNYSYNRASGELWLFGTQWFVIGARDEASYKQILGMTIGVVIIDEWTEFPRSFTMQLFLRMSPPGARLYATSNPGTPQHYLFTEVIHDESFANDLTVIHFTLDDNPNIDNTTKAQIIASQKGVYYQRYILGLWVVAEGAIYKDAWSDDLYYDDSSVPITLYGQGGYVNHIIAVDYGTTNPCCFLEAIDDGECAWWDREYYWDSKKEMIQKTDQQYVEDLINFINDSRIKFRRNPRIIVDPSAASFKVACIQAGLWVVDADNDVEVGIRRVATLMTTKRNRFHRELINFHRERGLYAWDPKAAEKGKEEPIKMNDHAMDTVRYGDADLYPEWRI